MKYIYLVLILFLNNIYANEELNRYLNDEKFPKYKIIKDEINNNIYIDLLGKENKLLIFTKNKEKYKKTFDEKLYFCDSDNSIWFTSFSQINNNYIISCFSNYIDRVQRHIKFYFNPKDLKLFEIKRVDANQDGVLKGIYIFKPEKNIKTLYDFKNKDFMDKYLDKNEKNFIEKLYDLIILEKQPLYKEANENSKTNMYLVINDVVEIIEEKEDWIYILYITKDEKEIKAWIPGNSLKFRSSNEE
ncbi:hypothetical protein FE246_08270 [Aliarcobacter thereius]|uniref:SH3 domain-containing protein n=1 Tax=Aliarcobacter thereius TaxID=544718 RepID=A0A5R9H4U1_9BACT|nr:hypothetical protein [Aliarcobacter thereius]TLS70953.1 hypothetical protein FE246_08270 [Aliarcobacter thereius]